MRTPKPSPATLAVITFSLPEEWEAWLEKHHSRSPGVWLKIQKKDSKLPSPNYAEALDIALCFGWIDGLKKPHDQNSWLQKFTPRRPRSGWSKRNTEHAERLIRTKKMRPAGLAEIAAAKKDGRWTAAYDPPSEAKVPADFIKQLKSDKAAHAFFKTLNKTNLYAIIYRLQTAKKPETRERRMTLILDMMKKGKKFHP